MAGYVDMKLDYSFKKSFSKPSILCNFLNDMLRGERQIVSVEPRNPEWMPPHIKDRKVIVDVYCTSPDGSHFIVEMQYAKQAYFSDRALYYDCFCVAQQGEQGRDWKFQVMPVVSIYVLNFMLHSDASVDEYRTDVGLTNLKTGKIHNPKLREIFIELPKFRKELHECLDDSEKWLYIIKNAENMDKNTFYPYLQDPKFVELLQSGLLDSYTKEEREQYLYARRLYRDNKNTYEYAVETGVKKGFKKGEQVGLRKGRKEGIRIGVDQGMRRVAKQMKQQGLPIQTIAICTGLTEEEIRLL